MTAPGSIAPQPGRAASAVSRPAVVLWALLLVGLLALLPCAGSAKAAAQPPPTAAMTTVAGPSPHAAADHHHARTAEAVGRDGTPLTWCSADGEHPVPGSCASHPFCATESQLPNAPPQPAAVAPPQLIALRALPSVPPIGILAGPDHAPDLHLLQVHRS